MPVLADQQPVPAAREGAAPPRHVAIIMDGNGRWAKARGLPRSEGHRRGVEAVRRTVRSAIDLGIHHLTLFSFSSENWSRPADEVDFLFGLFRHFIRRDVAELHSAGVRISVIGKRAGLPADILDMIEEAEALTAGNRTLKLIFAFNYGARDEIVRAVQSLAAEVQEGRIAPEAISEATIGEHLDTAAVPDPDLIIRTSGELRLSNFLLWQSAYSELVFAPVLWPDFNADALRAALEEFGGRSRRYGGRGPA
ncbi:MAG TPA: isoprenyl transferase [Bauldia sp.]|nr:isoprenyl transferase [Bauldia sp.]